MVSQQREQLFAFTVLCVSECIVVTIVIADNDEWEVQIDNIVKVASEQIREIINGCRRGDINISDSNLVEN